MGLTKIKLGKYIEPYSQRCNIPNLGNNDVSGVNKYKEFFEPSPQVGSDTSNYKNVPPSHFACNLMHVGRDAVLPIAYNHSRQIKVVSPAYQVFAFKENSELLSEYFFLYLKSSERDRSFWFHSDSSVRDSMSWQDFIDVDIELPPVTIQQKYVNVYNAMLANQKSYERGLADLKRAIDSTIEKYKSNTKRLFLSELIEECDERNADGIYQGVYGVNKDKRFMPTVSSGEDLSKYKLVKKDCFACNLMHIGRDFAIPISLNSETEAIIVSPAYFVFRLKSDLILPKFLLIWLSRSETDRYAWYISDSSIRGSMEKNRFYEISIPIPPLEEQTALVELFSVLSTRKELAEKLKNQIQNICPILIKGSIEEGMRTNEA